MEKIVAAGVVVKDKTVLLLQRADKEPGLDWCFPGGGIEQGEDVEAAVIREILEETGVHIKPVRILGDKIHPMYDHIRIVYVLCDYISGHAQVMDPTEGEAVEWVDVNDDIKSYVGRDYMPFIHDFLQTLKAE